MNKVQLIGTIQEISFDDINGKMGAEFTLIYKQKDTPHFFKCSANGEIAELLSRIYFKYIEVAIEGKLLNKQTFLSVGKMLEMEIRVSDILFLSFRK